MKRILLFLSMLLLVGGTTMAFANGANSSYFTRVSNNEMGASATDVVQPQNNNSSVKPLEATNNEPVITFTTSKKIGEKIKLRDYWGAPLSKSIKIEGATLENGSSTSYVLTAQTVKIIGNCTSLSCLENGITSIDLSNNSKLEILSCGSNQLTSLDLSKNSGLIMLYCGSNQLTSLDLSNNSKLETLSCGSNKLTSLDLSNNSGLTSLDCNSNKLTSLDLSNKSGLTYLACRYNQLTSLDLSNNSKLETLDCGSNQLTSLDLSNKSKLTMLYCFSNQLRSLDLSNNSKLTDLLCFSNQLTSLDLSNNSKLETLDCGANQLTSLDLSNNSGLTNLSCGSNQLTSLDLSNNSKLKKLSCGSNQLTSLDLSNNSKLTDLYCYSNQLTQIQLPEEAGSLAYLNCKSNNIDVEHMEQLINRLPKKYGNHPFYVQSSSTDGNQITKEQVQKARDKGWGVSAYRYTTPTGISTIDNAEASPRKVYDLNGCEVNENQAKGVVIVKQGNKTYKKVVK